MAKRKITQIDLAKAIVEHGGNVQAVARTLNVTAQTVYNTIDRYNMRADLEAERNLALESARMLIASAPKHLQVALTMLAKSTGSIDLLDIIKGNGE